MVSVIVPIYKVEEYLPRCIESIINQTYRNLEIILVDDGSPDNCGKICDEYARRDKRIKVFHKKNGGLSDARNYGIERATGEYLGFIDSDDWIERNMFEVLVKLAVKNKADIVNCAVYYDFPDRTDIVQIVDKIFDNNIDLIKYLVYYYNIRDTVVNKLYHKSCFSKIRFPKGHVYEDIATMYLLFLKARIAVSTSMPLYHYRKSREGSIMQGHSMSNLIDYWLAHKSRYDYFLSDSSFNTDRDFINKLLDLCAFAIARTWRWRYANSEQDNKKYVSYLQEMHDFCNQNFPPFGMSNWPFHVRLTIFMSRYNHKFFFVLLNYFLQGYKWLKNRTLQ